MTTTHTLTGTLLDLPGVADTRRIVSAVVSTNLGRFALVDLDNNDVRLPNPTRLTVNADGSFSVDLIATDSAGINVPNDLRYNVTVTYKDDQGVKRTWSSGYFELTANRDLSDVANTDAVANVSEAATVVNTLVLQALEDHTPGIELGRAERTTNFASASNADIAGLSFIVTGNGRPIYFEFYCPRVSHTVANTFVAGRIRKNGVQVQEGSVVSPVANTGPSMMVQYVETLPAGQSATYSVQAFQAAAGTMTFQASSTAKMHLVAVSR